jgi:hypothetical protein
MNHPTSPVLELNSPAHKLPMPSIQPHQVWSTVALAHQQRVFRTIVTICRTLLSTPSGVPTRKEALDDCAGATELVR